MGGKKKKSKAPQVATPKPANEYTKDAAGNIIAQRVWDPSTNSYTTQNFETPQQRLNRASFQNLQNQSMGVISDPTALNRTAKDFEKQFYAASVAPVVESANNATQQGIQAFGARGMLDSAGFANYLANQVEGNKQKALQTAAQNAQVYGQDAANQVYNRNVNNLQLGGSGQTDLNNLSAQQSAMVMNGANSTNQFNQNNAQIQLQNAANQMYAQTMNNQSRGLFGGLFG